MWHTLLRYVYKVKSIEEAKNQEAKKYIQKLKHFFDMSFLDQQKKGMKLISQLKKIDPDVFFFQQYSTSFYEAIKRQGEYYLAIDDSKDTLIIAKKTSFK